ncbi:MAG: FxsA family protein [Frankiales bacterium]|nr:FxsA family protein [Frankiales bacterium]MCW2585738.1 FxsA family protein [Frankiales bacterium]
MPLLLLLLFIVVPAIEIYVLIQVGQVIGVLPTIALLLVDAVLGTWLFKREGRKAWRALNEAVAAHRVPAKEVADGALVVLGGAFLLTPGFVTDVVGVLCLLPPTRALLRRALTKVVAVRMLGPAGLVPGPRMRGRSRRTRVIEGEIVDDDR